MFAYLFTVCFDEDGAHRDCFLDVSAAHGHTIGTYQRTVDTARKLGINTDRLKSLVENVKGITFRANCAGQRLYKVTTEEPITAEILDAVIRNKQSEGTLKTFLKASEV